MQKTVVAILVSHRNQAAANVQKVLTGWGCMIKTRLGIHEGILDDCSEKGLIILDLVGEEEKKEELVRKLNTLSGVSAKRVDLELD
ncbi:MAG: hypothetical protein R6V62_06230 [Candidatus Fermentibacteraceae bacterium]